jgi:hypothetical protein
MGIAGMFWRFLVADDEAVDRFIVRDTDSVRATFWDIACRQERCCIIPPTPFSPPSHPSPTPFSRSLHHHHYHRYHHYHYHYP